MTPSDLVLRYQLRLDGLANATLAELKRDIDKALHTVENKLIGTDADSFSANRFRVLRIQLSALQTALADRISGTVSKSLDAVTDTSAVVAQDVIQVILPGSPEARTRPTIPLSTLAAVKDRPFDGFSWQTWGERLAADTIGRIESELRQAVALGEIIPEIKKRLQSAGNLSKASAERLARTSINATSNRALVDTWTETLGDDLQGWRFISTLDGRTSSICQGLDGRTFKHDDPQVPFPPRHPNCRSIMVPVSDINEQPGGERPFVRDIRTRPERERDFRREAKERLGKDKWSALTEKQRRVDIRKEREKWQAANIGQTRARITYQQWLMLQPTSFQKEVLGSTRFKAFKRGLDLGQMATNDRTLSVDDLRRLYPQELRGQ